jgi:uncharacterized repeat protein (TIGR01451 family)
MNTTTSMIRRSQAFLAGVLCLALPSSTFANLTNVASARYTDAASNSYSATSNTVTVTTPPVITSAITATGDIGVAFSYQIVATNSPTSYNAAVLPTWATINTATGLISGTPTASGTTNVTLTASNAAGASAAVTLAITIRGSAVITLNKTSSVTTAKSGDTVTFTIAFTNTGAGSATNVAITDVIPTGSTLVAGSISGGGTLSGSTITWTIGTVASGGTGSVSFQVKVN